mgnify:CR=1 FL=1
MNIRDNVEVCGYCGGEIPQQPVQSGDSRSARASQRNTPPRPAQKMAAAAPPTETPEGEEGEEEEGGLSAILQPGEQVLIGSLNVSVKKFFFHAYLTNKRIFLIDTQEKKLKVTAKDIPRDTITDSSLESSENSDPVLVLAVKSVDDEVKTMKLVFAQNGTDRTGESEDWIALLHEEPEAKKPRRAAPPQKEPEPTPEEEPVEEPEEEVPARPVRQQPVRHEELRPTRKPLKELERQPPVKRLTPIVREAEPEPEPVPEPEPEIQPPQRRVQVRAVVEEPHPPTRRIPITRETPAPVKTESQIVRKPEVHAAMRTAMKNPVQPVRQVGVRPVRSITAEPIRRPVPEHEPVREIAPEPVPAVAKKAVPEEPVDNPQFCHNCGKRLPGEANFCPGCGTRLGRAKTDPGARLSKTIPRPVPPSTAATNTQPHLHKVPRIEEVRDEDEAEEHLPPKKPPVKKAPKGSDMTILQKFLRR